MLKGYLQSEEMRDFQDRDLKHIWHPCSQMKDYEEFPPIILERGKGAYLYDVDGKSYLDAVSSWWVNLFGHSNERLNMALKAQVDQLEHSIFANFSHRPAIELSERIVELLPDRLSKVFFSDNGSSAVEIALKMSFQYHMQTGQSCKQKFLALSGAYHGETIGALSVSGVDLYSDIYRPMLLDVKRVEGPDCYRCRYGLDRESCDAECFEAMEKRVLAEHKEISGIIVEPIVQCARGINIYSPKYLEKLRSICSGYGINLIADEIAVGFGRTGEMFGIDNSGISPDIVCLSKGLTAGYLPLALTVTTDEIYSAFYDDYDKMKSFLHSHSYTGNPLSCAVGVESLNIFRDENTIEQNRAKSKMLYEMVTQKLKGIEQVGEYRQMGMIGAIELVSDRESKQGFDSKLRVGYEIYKKAVSNGVLLRPLGNIIYFMPPYVVDKNDMDFMTDVATSSIKNYFNT